MNKCTISILTAIIIIIACEEDSAGPGGDSGPLTGQWRLHKTTDTLWVDGSIERADVDLFTIDDPYVFPHIVSFRGDTMSFCENVVFSTEYNCEEGYIYQLIGNQIILDEIGDDDIDTMEYSLDGNTFTIYYDWIDEFEDYTHVGRGETVWIRYTGDFPPSEWLTPLSNDAYEPDDSADEATPVTVGAEAVRHVWYPGDKDWFTFQAQAGTTYIIETYGSYLHWLSLLDTDRTTQLDVSESGWGNAKIEWTCPTSGNYYFKTSVHYEEGEDDAGAYYVSVVTG